MALTIYRQEDANLDPLRDKRIAIIGYGNQGRAHALNLRDSGIHVIVGNRKGPSADAATEDGFTVHSVTDATAAADLLVVTLPDESAGAIYNADMAPALRAGHVLGFVHGFNIRYGFINPPPDVDVVMVAPKGPGQLLRSLYESDLGLPALIAIHQDATGLAKTIALSWATGIGSTRAGVVETTFAAEADSDLFGEQAVLCGGMVALTKAAFETLLEAGFPPELAYIECVHELKQVVDLLYAEGLSAMRDRVSNTAEYGELTRGPQVIGPQVKTEMKRILADIQSGSFAKEWINEYQTGAKRFRALHDADIDSTYERAGKQVRALMPWLGKGVRSHT